MKRTETHLKVMVESQSKNKVTSHRPESSEQADQKSMNILGQSIKSPASPLSPGEAFSTRLKEQEASRAKTMKAPVRFEAGNQMQLLNDEFSLLIDPKNFSKEEMDDFTWDKRPLEQIQVQKMTANQWLEALIYTDLTFCSAELFKLALRRKDVLSVVSLHLMKEHIFRKTLSEALSGSSKTSGHVHRCKEDCFTRNQLDQTLAQIDMDLFKDFRDRKLNYKQLVAENMARRGLKTNKLV